MSEIEVKKGPHVSTQKPSSPKQANNRKVNNASSTSDKAAEARFQIIMPLELRNELDEFANELGTNAAELVRRYIRLGLMVSYANRDEGAKLILEQDGNQRELILV